jgi:dienelactone hydrolase
MNASVKPLARPRVPIPAGVLVRRVVLVAAGIVITLAVSAALMMLASARRDAVEQLKRAPPMRLVSVGPPANDRTRYVALVDRVGAVRATIRYAPSGAANAGVVVVLGGLATGRRAVDLVHPDLPYSVASLDFAWTGPSKLTGLELLWRAPQIQRDLMRTATALRDLIAALERDARVGGGRIYVIGASFGSPIATLVAVAVRPAGLVLLYGFADHATLLEYRLRPYVGSATLRRWVAGAGAALTANLDASNTLPRLCGTPVLVVAATDDRDLPLKCSDALWRAACSPRHRVDLPGGHLRGGRDTTLIARATSVVVQWLAREDSLAASHSGS